MNAEDEVGLKRLPEIVLFVSHRGRKILEPLQAIDWKPAAFVCEGSAGKRLRIFTQFLAFLRQNKEAAVVTDTAKWIGLMAWFGARIMGRPYLLRLRGDALAEFKGMGQWVHRLFYRMKLLPGASGVVPVSNYLLTQLREQELLSDYAKVRVVVTPQKIYQEPRRFHERDPLLLMVTAFRLPEKVAPLFTALPQIDELLSSDASIQVVVLGGGTLLEYFAEKVAQTRNYRRISMPGHIHNTEDWYLRARGLLHVSGLDAYPSVVNEARAYGLPVVVTPSVGMKEQVRDRIDGLLLDDTLTNLQEAWRLLSDPHFWQELSSEGRERVRRENDPIRVGRQFREAIEEFLS